MNPYVLLAVTEGCGPGMIPPLLDPSRDPRDLLDNPPPLPPAAVRRLRSKGLLAKAADWLRNAKAEGLTVLTPADDTYPDHLRNVPSRPNVLFARGNTELLNAPVRCLAIVGSRTHSTYGEAAARDFAGAIARAGVPIGSGLALGIDALAHRAALAEDRETIAVLAGGLDRIYPRYNEPLAAEIVAKGGLLLSESPPGMRAQRGHFPRRNRILALLAQAVLVVEAGLSSGTLHTARFATEFGVPVFAVPGPYTSPRSVGCHALIAEGAGIAASPEELLRDLGVEQALQTAESGDSLRASADEQAILDVLRHGPRPADLVAREARLQPGPFTTAVFHLTAARRICQLPGDQLALTRS